MADYHINDKTITVDEDAERREIERLTAENNGLRYAIQELISIAGRGWQEFKALEIVIGLEDK